MRIVRFVKKGEEKEYDDFYSEETRDALLEEDEISPEEEAFMEGWDLD